MDDPHSATRALIAREVLLILVKADPVRWDPEDLAATAWDVADAFVAQSEREPGDRG